MANTDFGILLKTLLDKSDINSELEQVQKIVNKYSIDIMPELKTASLRNQMKAVSEEIANDFNKTFGTNLTGKDVFKAYENQVKQAKKAIEEQEKAIKKAAEERAKAEKERLAYIEQQKSASAKAQNNKENARIQEANSLLSQQKSAYQEIWNIHKKISSLDPNKDSEQISALNEKKKIYQETYLSIQKQLQGYVDIISNEERMKVLAEVRKKTESEIAVIKGKQSDNANAKESARIAKETAQAEKERLATLEKQRVATANSAKEKAKSNTQQELAQQKEINAILSRQESAYKEIWNINKQIATLDPTKNSEQISALNKKKKFYQEAYLSAQKELQTYNNITVSQEHLVSLAEIRKKAESEIGVAVAKQNEALAKAQAEKVNKIQLSMETGGYESKVDSLIGKTQQWVDANGNARISTDALQTAMNNLNTAYANITATGGNTVANQQALIEAERALDTEIKKVQSSVTSMNATMAKSSEVDALRQKVQQFYDINTKSHRLYGTQLQNIMSQLASGAEVPKVKLRQLAQEFVNIGNSARVAGKLGLSFFDTLKQGMKSFSYWTSSTFIIMKTITEIKQAVTSVKELDYALVDLKKTTTMTNSQLEEFYYISNETAKKMGVTTKEIIEQASAWSRFRK